MLQRELGRLLFTPLPFCRRRWQAATPTASIRCDWLSIQAVRLFEVCIRITPAFFQAGQSSSRGGSCRLQLFAADAQRKNFLRKLSNLLLDIRAFRLERCSFFTLAGDEILPLLTLVLISVCRDLPLLESIFEPSGLLLHLAQGGAGVSALTFRLATLVISGIKGRRVVGDLSPKRCSGKLILSELRLDARKLAL